MEWQNFQTSDMSAFEEETSKSTAPGRLIVALFFLVLGAGGLALLPGNTGASPGDEGWYTQPWLMPLLTLGLLTVVSLVHTLKVRRASREASGGVADEIWMWLRAAEFFGWYALYILLLGWVGYGLSTFIFIAELCLRVGLRQPKWLFAALGVALAMTALFRLGLKIWVPAADLYEFMPKDVRNFLQRYF